MNKFTYIILLSVLLTVAGLFYWFSVRPENIRKECYQTTKQKAEETRNFSHNTLNAMYQTCLTSKGMKSERLIIK